MRTRFVVPVGTRAWLRIFWDGPCGRLGYHNAMSLLGDDLVLASKKWGQVGDHLVLVGDLHAAAWPAACEDCGAVVPQDGRRQVFCRTLYGTPDGSWRGIPGPGDMYIADWYGCEERGGHCIHGWTNCDGRHLIVQLPGDAHHWWDVDGRASNCTLPNDTLHRCWVRHGDPAAERVHVDKKGRTCAAGAGSIASGNYHGFLHNGELTGC